MSSKLQTELRKLLLGEKLFKKCISNGLDDNDLKNRLSYLQSQNLIINLDLEMLIKLCYFKTENVDQEKSKIIQYIEKYGKKINENNMDKMLPPLYDLVENFQDLLTINKEFLKGKLGATHYMADSLFEEHKSSANNLIKLHDLGIYSFEGQNGFCDESEKQRPYLQFFVEEKNFEKILPQLEDQKEYWYGWVKLPDSDYSELSYGGYWKDGFYKDGKREDFDNPDEEENTYPDPDSEEYNRILFNLTKIQGSISTFFPADKKDIISDYIDQHPNIMKALNGCYSMYIISKEYCKNPIEKLLLKILQK
jgi:hypothetical protein